MASNTSATITAERIMPSRQEASTASREGPASTTSGYSFSAS